MRAHATPDVSPPRVQKMHPAVHPRRVPGRMPLPPQVPVVYRGPLTHTGDHDVHAGQVVRQQRVRNTRGRNALSGVAQWVGHHPTKHKVAGSLPSQGTYKRQPIDVSLSH